MAETLRADGLSREVAAAGTVLADRYELVEGVGKGSYGEVWRANDLLNPHHRVAVKLVRTDVEPAFARRRFQDECSALELLLQSSHIVKILGRGVFHGRDFMVMEYLEGQALSAWLRSANSGQPPTWETAFSIISQVCEAVAAAHRLTVPGPIVHLDIKPENIIVTEDRQGALRVTLFDFGVARLGPQPEVAAAREALGTVAYMAPEQALNRTEDIGHWSDVFALGVLLVELLTLEPYGPGGSPLRGLAGRQRRELLSHLKSRRPDIKGRLWSILLRAVAHRPSDRFQDADALRAALQQVSPSSPSLLLPAAESLQAPWGGFRRYRGLGIGLSLPLLLGLAVGPWLRGRSQRSPALPMSMLGATRPVLPPDSARPIPIAEKEPAGPKQPPEMVFLPGGTFKMGSSFVEATQAYHFCVQAFGSRDCAKSAFLREQPARRVMVSPFWMDRTEVTQARLVAWLNTLRRLRIKTQPRDPRHEPRYVLQDGEILLDLYPGMNGAHSPHLADGIFTPLSGMEEHPAVLVSWELARSYCAAHGKRLPTEAEWEYAARGESNQTFPWGEHLPRCGAVSLGQSANYCAGTQKLVLPVGVATQDVTPQGIHDLGGNVSEWVADAFRPGYPPCSPEPCVDPQVRARADKGSTLRVIRGGNWDWSPATSRSATRSHARADFPSYIVGFRCAASQPFDTSFKAIEAPSGEDRWIGPRP